MYTVFIKDTVFLCDFPDPGLSLKAGSRGFAPALAYKPNHSDYFRRKKNGHNTDRMYLYNSLSTNLHTQQIEVFATSLQTTCDLFTAKTGTSSSVNLRS